MRQGWRFRRKRGCLATSIQGLDGNGSLHTLKNGARAEVSGIAAGAKARSRLASLGLIQGAVLQVITNPGFGPLLLCVGESRLMVERGIAAKVLVQQV